MKKRIPLVKRYKKPLPKYGVGGTEDTMYTGASAKRTQNAAVAQAAGNTLLNYSNQAYQPQNDISLSDEQNAQKQTMVNTIDSTASSVTPWYGMAKGASNMGKSFIKKDEFGEAKSNTGAIAEDWLTPDHELIMNGAQQNGIGGALFEASGFGKVSRTLGTLTGNSDSKDGVWGWTNKMNGNTAKTDAKQGIIDTQKAAEDQANALAAQQANDLALQNNIALNAKFGGITGETYIYNKVYSYENNINRYIPKPFGFNETSVFNNRVYWSEVKYNGEPNDSFTTIPALNFYDVDGNYGEITAFISLKDDVHFLQERAFGTLYINPQAVIPDQNDQPLKLGTANIVLDKHFYISTDAGSRHQWSAFRSNSALTFIDTRSKKIYMYNSQSLIPVSDLKGMKGFMNKVLHDDILITDNPIIENGILTTYDFENNEFIYTFLNTFHSGTKERNTLAYSDLINAFSSFYSFTPYVYLNNHNKLYSLSSFNNSKIYQHNVGNYGIFYDLQYNSALKLNVNPNPLTTKVFDNLSWITDVTSNIELDETTAIQLPNETFNTIRCYNDTQNTDTQFLVNTPVVGNIRKVEGSWNIQVPRNKVDLIL